MVSTPSLSLPACTYSLVWSSLWSVDRWRENLGPVYRWLCMAGRVDSCSTILLIWDILEGEWWGEIFPVYRISWSTWLFNLLKRENGQICDCVLIHGLWPMVRLDHHRFGGNMIEKNWWQRNLGKKYIDIPLWMDKKIKIFVALLMLTNGSPQQIRISIIKWMAWTVLWIPARSCHQTMGSWTKLTCSKDEGYAWAQ